MANFFGIQVGVLVKQNRAPIVLTKRGERVMLVVCWFSLVLLIAYAEDLSNLFN